MVEVAGTILVALGVTSLALGLVSIPLAVPPCAINACPPLFSRHYAADWGEIFAGLIMIALGIGLSLRLEGFSVDWQHSIQGQHLLH